MGSIKKDIIIIDNDHLICFALKKIISRIDSSFELHTYQNGSEGLGHIYAKPPALIILDTTLPNYDGKEIVRYIESSNKIRNKHDIPLILIHEDNNIPSVNYENLVRISKKDLEFVKKLQSTVSLKLSGETFGTNKTRKNRIGTFLAQAIVFLCNENNLISKRFSYLHLIRTAFWMPVWVTNFLSKSIYLGLFMLFG